LRLGYFENITLEESLIDSKNDYVSDGIYGDLFYKKENLFINETLLNSRKFFLHPEILFMKYKKALKFLYSSLVT